MANPPLVLRALGRREYHDVWRAMQAFTTCRDHDTADEFWLVEHPPLFTQGLTGKPEHLLAPGEIPVIQVDRGGQVTYHGPGQLVLYLLLDLRRRRLGIRQAVDALEQGVIGLLADYGCQAQARTDAPGVYVEGAKIASLGLRVRRGCCYHGLSLNVDMDLEPFQRIHPCGQAGLKVTQLRDLGLEDDIQRVATALVARLAAELGYPEVVAAQDNRLPDWIAGNEYD